MFQKILAFGVMLVLLGCQKSTSKENVLRPGEVGATQSAVSLPAQAEGLRGKIEIYENNPDVYFVLRWETRSRITYRVVNPDVFQLRKMKDKILKVEGKTTNTSQWSGEIEITKILEIE